MFNEGEGLGLAAPRRDSHSSIITTRQLLKACITHAPIYRDRPKVSVHLIMAVFYCELRNILGM